MPNEEQQVAVAAYKWAASVADQFEEDEQYEYDPDERKVELTADGRRMVRALTKPDAMHNTGMFTIYEYVERKVSEKSRSVGGNQHPVMKGELEGVLPLVKVRGR